MVNRGVFLIRFLHKAHQEKACDMNGILFDKKPFIVEPWTSSISYEKSSLTKIPVWVKLPKLDIRYWTEDMLRIIVGYLGTLLKIHNATVTKSRMMFARVLVDMNVEDGFLDELYFSNENDMLITQVVQYDWLPIWCAKCSQFGHNRNDCREGQPRVHKPTLEVDAEGFRPYRKGFVNVEKRVEPIEEVDETDSGSEVDGKEANSLSRATEPGKEQVLVEVGNGFSPLADIPDSSLEPNPNIALGADHILVNG
ncbi:unnamed protein product [Amaranthus hypochondriacus]